MDLNIYNVIKNVRVTGKSSRLFDKLGKITFEVHSTANKVMVREAVEKIWNVKVANVRIMNVPGKNKVFARKTFKTADKKKAIITLKKGYKIELPGQFETMGTAAGSSAKGEETKGT